MKLIKSIGGMFASLILLSGCASYPDNVSVPEGTELASFSAVKNNESQLLGTQARWSGVIAGVRNEADKTKLDVLFYPARSNGRPQINDEPEGRFRVYVNGFLDPEIYKKGKSITALGQVAVGETEKIDEYEYLYPTLKGAKLHLWKKLEEPAKVEFYYGWHGHHPRWYWTGGQRHTYIIGDSKRAKPTGVTKSGDKKQ